MLPVQLTVCVVVFWEVVFCDVALRTHVLLVGTNTYPAAQVRQLTVWLMVIRQVAQFRTLTPHGRQVLFAVSWNVPVGQTSIEQSLPV